MAFQCMNCDQQTEGEPNETVTGRLLCDPCNDNLLGLSAGMIASGGDVGQSIATAGAFSWIRRWRRGED